MTFDLHYEVHLSLTVYSHAVGSTTEVLVRIACALAHVLILGHCQASGCDSVSASACVSPRQSQISMVAADDAASLQGQRGKHVIFLIQSGPLVATDVGGDPRLIWNHVLPSGGQMKWVGYSWREMSPFSVFSSYKVHQKAPLTVERDEGCSAAYL